MNCISENNLRAYRDGEIEGNERLVIAEHLAGCAQCTARLEEMAALSERVDGRIGSLDASAALNVVDAQDALARFRAEHTAALGEPVAASGSANAGVVAMKPASRIFNRRSRPIWVGAVAATILLCGLAFPSGRSLAQRFLATLRIEKVQPIRLDFSALDGNRPLEEMLGQVLSDKVVVTAKEKSQPAETVADATQLAGFPVKVIGARTDAPKLTVDGQHAFHLTVDRARMQDIFDQAGRGDLALPAALDGATISVNIPRSVRMEYGNCPHEHIEAEGPSADGSALSKPQTAQTQAAAQTKSAAWSNCLALVEAPSPQVNLPSDLNIQQLAEIGFQLSGMSATEARQLAQTIDWKSTLVLPMPRGAGSYSEVQVGGSQGTLINGSGRRGPDYVLIWVKSGIIYGLVGHGDSSNAVALANSLN
jgi:hypothetical protein